MGNKSDYSLLGFSCETARRELQKYSKKKGFRLIVIKDAHRIFESFQNIIQNKPGEYKENRKEIIEYILDYVHQNSIPIEEKREFPKRIVKVNNLLEGIVKGDKIQGQEIQEGIKFLEDIRDWCKEKVSSKSFY
jgi:hypothetical protein